MAGPMSGTDFHSLATKRTLPLMGGCSWHAASRYMDQCFLVRETMSKPTKTQRCKRRKEKELKRWQDRAQQQRQPKLKAWEAPKMKLFQMPKLIRGDLSWEERLTLLRAVGDEAKAAFEDKYSNIQRWVTDFDPVYVLSMCAFYFSSFQEGTDPEAAGKLEFFPHYLEIMQAFALYQPRSLNLTALGADMDRLKSEMSEIGQVMSIRYLAIPEAITTEDELNAYHLRTEMMMATTAVRNWAYPHQMQRVVLDLAMAIHAEFLDKYKVDPVAFFTMMFRLADERSGLLNSHISRLRNVFGKKHHREIVASYNDAFPEHPRCQRSCRLSEMDSGVGWGWKVDIRDEALLSRT